MSALAKAVAGLREIAPYALIELILPGGSLVALLLWLYRRRSGSAIGWRGSVTEVTATGSPSGWLARFRAAIAPCASDHVTRPERQSQDEEGQHNEQQEDFACQCPHLLPG